MTERSGLPSRARVVIIGGGVIGTSVAYHLTRLGWTDVLLRRAGPAVLRHDLARGRAGRPAAGLGERHAAGAVLHPALRRARGRGRAVDRLQAVRRRHGRAHRGPDDAAPAYGGERGRLRAGVHAAHAGRGAGALPGHAGRRPGRRDLAARRRDGQPDRPDPGAGEGRAAAGCPDRREDPGPRRARRRRPRDRRAHRRRRRRGRGRRELRGTVGQAGRRAGRGRPCRCTPPSTSTS